jgi:NitT/TauT family transport system ATP-binding protein
LAIGDRFVILAQKLTAKMMPTSHVVVRDAMVHFGALHVLGPVSFEVGAGKCTVLLGPSGCGKSTLLAALAGLQALAGGTALIGEGKNQPGFVFQDATLMPWASALDNVALPLALTGQNKSDQRARAQAALDQVGIGTFSAAKPRALSGGMKMRVALARALVSQPDTLLLDEPFAAIDELGRRALNDLVHHAKQQSGLTVVFVTHSVEEAVYMADTILVLSPRPGQIVARIEVADTPRDAHFWVSDAFAASVAEVRRALAPESGVA